MNSPNDPSPQTKSTPEFRPNKTKSSARKRRLTIGLSVLALVLVGAVYGGWSYFRGVRAPFNGPVWEVKRQRLQVVIVERGALESAENSDVVCRVKAGKKGTSGLIKWVIDDGAQVEKGQKLMEIEDSALQEDLKDQINKVNKAKADWISAKESLQITESSNFSDIESAKTTQILAEIELKKFLGDAVAAKVLPIATRAELQRYLVSQIEIDLARQADLSTKSISEVIQTLNEIEGRIELAKSDNKIAKDRSNWSLRMVSRGYISRSQADADKSKFDGARLALEKTQLEYDLFRRYTVEQKVTELWSKVKEADRALDRVKSQADSKRNTAVADLESKKAVYEQEVARRIDIEEEISKCMIYAPQSGLVVYHISEQSKWGSGSQSMIAQGEPVKEGQKLMRIPNLTRMLVNTRVHEAMVSKIKGEVNLPTGYSEVLRATLNVNPLPVVALSTQFAFIEIRDEDRDTYRARDFRTIESGQSALIQIDAHPGRVYKGHVKNVATVAAQSDWMSSDVKVYQTMVSIDDTVDNLKPGMSAQVTIMAEENTEPVLTIPIQSVDGSIAMGEKRKCHVVDNGLTREVEIVVGRSNDKLVEVKEGLEEGMKVVLNPRSLPGFKGTVRSGPTNRRGADADDMGSGGTGGKKTGKKKGMGPPDGMPPGGFNPGGPPGAFNPSGPGGKQFNRPESLPTTGKKLP